MKNKFYVLIGVFALVAVVASSYTMPFADVSVKSVNAAGADYYLKLDGIDGEVADRAFLNNIEISSFAWAEDAPGISRPKPAGGIASGKPAVNEISFTKKIDKSSPELMARVASSKRIRDAVLYVKKSGEPTSYYTIKLSDVVISSYKTSGGNASTPTDQFSLNFAKIEYSVRSADNQTLCTSTVDVKLSSSTSNCSGARLGTEPKE